MKVTGQQLSNIVCRVAQREPTQPHPSGRLGAGSSGYRFCSYGEAVVGRARAAKGLRAVWGPMRMAVCGGALLYLMLYRCTVL